jgi:hypothetical protein
MAQKKMKRRKHYLSTNSEQFCKIVKLPVNITAYCNRTLYRLQVLPKKSPNLNYQQNNNPSVNLADKITKGNNHMKGALQSYKFHTAHGPNFSLYGPLRQV